jgi:hypothetical protein
MVQHCCVIIQTAHEQSCHLYDGHNSEDEIRQLTSDSSLVDIETAYAPILHSNGGKAASSEGHKIDVWLSPGN